MSDARLLHLVKDYMRTIRMAAGNDEFLELLAKRLSGEAQPLHVLDNMPIGELHELFGDWITEHDE